jgi:hypothetical protein
VSPPLKDPLKFLHGNRESEGTDEQSSQTPDVPDILGGSWPDFEAWIRTTIGGKFRWGARPRDNRENRQMVAGSIRESIRKNNGTFPQRNAFIERQE